MRGSYARGVAVAASAAAALVLAGCGSDEVGVEPMPRIDMPPAVTDDRPGPAPGGGTAAESPHEAPGSAPSVDQDALGDLAALAEQSAREQDDLARTGLVLGADISWPQCPRGLGIPERRSLGLPPPLPEAEYVIIGLTNGPAFTRNPCLADQVESVRSSGRLLAAYAVTSYPDDEALEAVGDDGPYDGSSAGGALANTGYRQAAFGVAEMERTGLATPVVWVDVEPVSGFGWSSDLDANAAVVRGVVRGYEDAGYEVGIYSTAYLWAGIVGDLELGLPEWRAAGETSRAEALERCGPESSIQGGEPVMGQWLADSRDHDVTCPGVSADLGRWFADPG